MLIKKLTILSSTMFVSTLLVCATASAKTYPCSDTFCTTGTIHIKHEVTDHIKIECASPNQYLGNWHEKKSSDAITCREMSSYDSHSYIYCTNWATIWGSTHSVNITWNCSAKQSDANKNTDDLN